MLLDTLVHTTCDMKNQYRFTSIIKSHKIQTDEINKIRGLITHTKWLGSVTLPHYSISCSSRNFLSQTLICHSLTHNYFSNYFIPFELYPLFPLLTHTVKDANIKKKTLKFLAPIKKKIQLKILVNQACHQL